jgi:hypothetical protein
MKPRFNAKGAFYALASAVLILSCKKEDSLSGSSFAEAATITVAASSTTAVTDSVRILQACARGEKRDSIAASALPAAVSSYLDENYSGYSFNKAFVLKDASGNPGGYVVVIYYNDKPVGIKFDASGTFVKVLEQREKGDLNGPGFHHGGRFEHRDGQQRDTVALSALPASVLAYFNAHYTTDTLLKAFKGRDGNYVVLSRNGGAFATVFNAEGNFEKRIALCDKRGSIQTIEQTALPAAVSSYLNTSYPNFVFKKAFVVRDGSAVKAYVVFIDANNTKYAVEFDATGNFVKAKTIF